LVPLVPEVFATSRHRALSRVFKSAFRCFSRLAFASLPFQIVSSLRWSIRFLVLRSLIPLVFPPFYEQLLLPIGLAVTSRSWRSPSVASLCPLIFGNFFLKAISFCLVPPCCSAEAQCQFCPVPCELRPCSSFICPLIHVTVLFGFSLPIRPSGFDLSGPLFALFSPWIGSPQSSFRSHFLPFFQPPFPPPWHSPELSLFLPDLY